MAHAAGRLVVVLWLAAGAASAYEATLDRRAIEEAIVIGQSRLERTRVRFHEGYRIVVGEPPVDYVEVVTPFRRVVLAAEAERRRGGVFGQREALAVLAAGGGALNLIVELTFHPLNTYVGVPAYDVTLRAAGARQALEPLEIVRVPRFGPRLDGPAAPSPYPGPGPPDGSQPMLGGTLITRFDGALLDRRGTSDLLIGQAGREIARARVNLGELR